jgi:hypothetical protein
LRSRVTKGRRIFAIGGDGRGAWVSLRKDIEEEHIEDFGGMTVLSRSQKSLCRAAATLDTEMQQIEARMSEGKATPEDLDLYNRLSGNHRRILESIGLHRIARPVHDGSGELLDYFSRPIPKDDHA